MCLTYINTRTPIVAKNATENVTIINAFVV